MTISPTITPDGPGPAMPRRFLGRTAVVTGSTSGIGLGIATALAAEGANLVLNGFGDAATIEAMRAQLAEKYAVGVVYSDADLASPLAVRELFELAKVKFGLVDILVNNAAIQFVSPIEDFPDSKWDSILAINLSAAFHTIKAMLPDMRAHGYGRIINISAVHGLVAEAFKSAYVASKHGLIGLTKAAALEAATSGVTCNAICPAYVWTPLVEQQVEEQARKLGTNREVVVSNAFLADQPQKQFATIEQIGAIATFLCSDAAACITGAAIPADGGWSAR